VSLLDAISTSLSGISAAQKQLDAIASNIANANTPGYRVQRVEMVSLPTGGVEASIRTDNSSAPIDVAKESVNLVKAKSLYAANGMVIKTDNQMLGSLLDMFDRDHTDTNI